MGAGWLSRKEKQEGWTGNAMNILSSERIVVLMSASCYCDECWICYR